MPCEELIAVIPVRQNSVGYTSQSFFAAYIQEFNDFQ